MSMPRRPIPPYLSIVPAAAGAFCPPTPPALSEMRVRRVADAVDALTIVIERLVQAVQDNDHLVARALSGQLLAEARAARCAVNLLLPPANP